MTYGSSSYGSTSYGTDGTARLTVEINFTIDALLSGERRFTLDAILLKTSTKTFSLDSILVLRKTTTLLLDALKQKTFSKTYTLDARTQKGQTKTFTITSILVHRRETTYSIDSRIKKTQSKTFTIGGRAYVSIHWLNPWKKRKKKTIYSSLTTASTNFIERIIIHKGSGTDTGTDVYLNNGCKDNFGDIRFTDSDGIRLLNYKIISFISGVSAIVYVQIPYLPATPDTHDIYLYYENSSATDIGTLIGTPTSELSSILNLNDLVDVSPSSGGCLIFLDQTFITTIPSGLTEAWVARKGLTLKSDIIGGGINGVAADDLWTFYINGVLNFAVSLVGDTCSFTGTLPCSGGSPSTSSGQSVDITTPLIPLIGQSVSFKVNLIDSLPVRKWGTDGAIYFFTVVNSAINIWGTEETKFRGTIFRTHRVGVKIFNG